MQRNFFLLLFMVIVIASPVRAYSNQPTTSDRVNKVNAFNQMTDYFATRGQSDLEKADTLQSRRAERRVKRLQSIQRKKQKAQRRKEQKIEEDQENRLRR